MVRNKLSDLNNHLFERLERLNDDELLGEELDEEIKRTQAVVSVGKTIIMNGSLVLQAQKLKHDYMNADAKMPKMLEADTE